MTHNSTGENCRRILQPCGGTKHSDNKLLNKHQHLRCRVSQATIEIAACPFSIQHKDYTDGAHLAPTDVSEQSRTGRSKYSQWYATTLTILYLYFYFCLYKRCLQAEPAISPLYTKSFYPTLSSRWPYKS